MTCSIFIKIRSDVNPNDMEEAIWAFLCESKMEEIGFDGARKRMLPAGA